MAHGIMSNSDYASTQTEWHGLGNRILPEDDLDTIAEKAGLKFTIQKAFVRYPVARTNEHTHASELRTVEDKVVLFRTDTGAPLGVVSDGYKVVQPKEGIELFREWVKERSMALESAGALFGGKRYFATAKLTEASFEALEGPGGKDIVKNYALFNTSADGTLATEVGWRAQRVVCNNTLTIARAEGKAEYRLTHRSTFRPEEAKRALEAAKADFKAFMDSARLLAGIRVTSKQAEDLYLQLLVTPKRDEDKVRESAAFQKMMALFNGEGRGSMLETARETAWGVLQGTTEYVDHWARAHSDENRLVSAMWGSGDDVKSKMLSLLLSA